MLFCIFIFIKCILSEPDFSKCQFVDSIKSLSSNKLHLTPTTINNYHYCNIHNFFDATFENDLQSNIQITKIPDQLFYDCFIGTLTLSEEITTIGIGSFSYCRINEIKFYPKSKLMEISNYAFYRAQIINKLQFPCSILNIGNFSIAFSKLSAAITLPNSVTSIGNSAFLFCGSLSSITIQENVASIGVGAFSRCKKLEMITVSLGNPHFKSIEGVLFNKDGSELICYPSGKEETTYKVPDHVKSICKSSFSKCRLLLSITLSNNVTSICDSAFWYCSELSTITLPNSIKSIGESAFSDCRTLYTITLPNSVKSIGKSVFYGCYSLSSIVLSNSVKSIDESSFSTCYSLSSITIPNSVTSIGNSAFGHCKLLSSITITENVASIGVGAFSRCKKLEMITVSLGNPHFKSIEGVLFNKDGSELICYPSGKEETTYKVPDHVKSICKLSFSDCSLLSSITIPNSVTSIGKSAFLDCSSLSSITLSNNILLIGDFALKNKIIKKVAFGYLMFKRYYSYDHFPHVFK